MTLVALWAGLNILTIGPRSVEGRTAAPAPEGAADVAINPDDPPEVMWDVLAGLNLSTGELSEELAKFVGKEVKVPGFMLPLEDWAERAAEFLLVPYVGACVHTPPPPPNQLVYIEMAENERVEVSYWDPVWIHGTLEIEETVNVYGSVSFKMTGMKLTPYEW